MICFVVIPIKSHVLQELRNITSGFFEKKFGKIKKNLEKKIKKK